MSKKTYFPIPIQKVLRMVGKNISDARRRRRRRCIAMELMSKRCGFYRSTLSRIEKGDPNVSMGAYASSLFVLGMSEQLASLVHASHDIVGRKLEEEHLPKRIRSPKGNIGNKFQ